MTHKGIVCPHCGYDGKDKSKIECTSEVAFALVEDIQQVRTIRGFNAEGELIVECDPRTPPYFDEGVNERVICGACCEEFPIPDDIRRDWV